MRLGYDLCAEEQDFVCKRKRYVAAALKKLLHLKDDLHDDEVGHLEQCKTTIKCDDNRMYIHKIAPFTGYKEHIYSPDTVYT